MAKAAGWKRGAGAARVVSVEMRLPTGALSHANVYVLPAGGADPRVTTVFTKGVGAKPVIYNAVTRTWYVGSTALLAHGEMDALASHGAGDRPEIALVRGYVNARSGRVTLHDLSLHAGAVATMYRMSERTVGYQLSRNARAAELNAPIVRGKRAEVSYTPLKA